MYESSGSMYKSSGSQFFRTTSGRQSEPDAFDEMAIQMAIQDIKRILKKDVCGNIVLILT